MPHTRLAAKLKALSTTAGNRVYPIKRLQRSDLPAITYRRTARVPVNWASGTTQTSFHYFEVQCWAATYDAAMTLAGQVRGDEDETAPTGVSGWTDDEGEVWHLESETDEVQKLKGGRDDFEAYCIVQDYMM